MVSNSKYVVVHIKDRIRPEDRYRKYERPIEELLKDSGYGEISGGGTLVSEEGEMLSCDIEVELEPETEVAKFVPKLLHIVSELHAPK